MLKLKLAYTFYIYPDCPFKQYLDQKENRASNCVGTNLIHISPLVKYTTYKVKWVDFLGCEPSSITLCVMFLHLCFAAILPTRGLGKRCSYLAYSQTNKQKCH